MKTTIPRSTQSRIGKGLSTIHPQVPPGEEAFWVPLDHLYEMEHDALVLRCVTLELALTALIEWADGDGSDDFGEVFWAQARAVLQRPTSASGKAA